MSISEREVRKLGKAQDTISAQQHYNNMQRHRIATRYYASKYVLEDEVTCRCVLLDDIILQHRKHNQRMLESREARARG